MKGSNEKKYILILAVVCVVLVVVWFWAYIGVKSSQASYAEIENSLDSEGVKEEYLRITKKEFRDNAPLEEDLRSYFVYENKEVDLLERIEGLADVANVRMEVKNFEKKGTVLRMVLEADGSFSRLYYFIELIEHLPYKIAVEKAVFAENKGDFYTTWDVKLDVRVNSYWLEEK